ncbi:MAG: bifunctional oligoribonuclease/PAP phosphatase NrnA [Campylobacteraceae bacterium]|jgi:phosphoesterase RecJ-like protein|nr:bifunctional oligoribonuclease/PAP phosphatase NrnA [Campylobacteraceae bacterium]
MFKAVWQAIENAQNIVLVSHINPDCDTLGCTLALYDVLQKSDKNVFLFNATENLPRKLRFMPYFNEIRSTLPSKFDAVVVCDCARFDRTGLDIDAIKKEAKIINIDHHLTNSDFGDVNLVISPSASASIVVYEMLKRNGITPSSKAASCLYTGTIDDTGFFAYGTMNASTFSDMAELVTLGADPVLISKQLKQSVPLARFRLKEYVARSFDLLRNGMVGLVFIWQEDLKRTGAKREDTEDIINLIRDIVSVEMAVMILEEEDGSFKVSLRSKNYLDVSKIALKFGGGGHFGAAGFESGITHAGDIAKMILNEFDKGIKEYGTKMVTQE